MKNVSTSRDEQIVFYYIQQQFPNAINRYQFSDTENNRYEADIYLPELNIVIEYDGVYWHKDKFERDIEKNVFFNSREIFVIRIRETGLKKLPPFYGMEFFHKVKKSKKGLHTNEYITELMHELAKHCFNIDKKNELEKYELTYEQLISDLPDILSIYYTEPAEICITNYWEFKYWDYMKNGRLNPNNVSYDDNIRVWLKGPGGCSKNVNVSFVTHSSMRRDVLEDDGVSRICPLIGNPSICESVCDYFNQRLYSFVDSYLDGQIQDKIDKQKFMRYIAQCEHVISYALERRYKDEISVNKKFEELFIETLGSDYICNFLGSQKLNISKTETLQSLIKLYTYYPDIEIMFDVSQFDNNDDRRNAVINYLDTIFNFKDELQRGCIIDSLFWPVIGNNNITDEFLSLVKQLLKKYKVKYILPQITNALG